MSYWWEDSPDEKYWAEITDRHDLGADLKCPQTNKGGKSYWSYDLIRSVWPGDIVFHYSTRHQRFVGASVAGGPVEARSIVWTPHSTIGRAGADHRERPGWWLPLYGFSETTNPLTLSEVQQPHNQLWFLDWLARMKENFKGQLLLHLSNLIPSNFAHNRVT